MRVIQIAVIAVLVAATLIFAVQNLETVTVSFLNFGISAPLALVVAMFYLLGMITGGAVWALLRWATEGPRRTPDGSVA